MYPQSDLRKSVRDTGTATEPRAMNAPAAEFRARHATSYTGWSGQTADAFNDAGSRSAAWPMSRGFQTGR